MLSLLFLWRRFRILLILRRCWVRLCVLFIRRLCLIVVLFLLLLSFVIRWCFLWWRELSFGVCFLICCRKILWCVRSCSSRMWSVGWVLLFFCVRFLVLCVVVWVSFFVCLCVLFIFVLGSFCNFRM